jgi:hypothetical protein
MSQKVFLCFKIAQGEALFPRKDYFKQYYIVPTKFTKAFFNWAWRKSIYECNIHLFLNFWKCGFHQEGKVKKEVGTYKC